MEQKVKEFLIKVCNLCVKSIYDSLEQCFDELTFATGHRLVRVLRLELIFLLAIVVLYLLNVPTFISIQEIFSCVVMTFLLVIVDKRNRAKIKKFKIKLKGGVSNGQ